MNNHQEKKKEQIKNDRLVRGRPKYEKVDKLLPEVMRVHFYEESAQFWYYLPLSVLCVMSLTRFNNDEFYLSAETARTSISLAAVQHI